MTLENIIDKFDFEKVRAYLLLTTHNKIIIPDIQDLKNTAMFLLNSVLIDAKKSPSNFHFACLGNLRAVYNYYDKTIRLEFIMEIDKAYYRL